MLRRVRWIWSVIGVMLLCDDPGFSDEVRLASSDFSRDDVEVKAEATETSWAPEFVEIDTERVSEVLQWVVRQVQGDYEVDLGLAKGMARSLSKWLSATEETQGYAAWLQARYPTWPERWSFRIGGWNRQPMEPRVLGVSREREEEEPEEGQQKPVCGAEHYVERLKPIFESVQVPVELVWVAEVESAFNPMAVSPVGAAGLYQLMPSTARQYGLELEPEDDRFIPEKNARAAARHMLYLKQLFDDWHLVMAAYNAGHNRVRALLAKHNARSFAEISMYLPLETQLFVPKVEATLVKREGVTLAHLGSTAR